MGPGQAATRQRASVPGAALERLLGSVGSEGIMKQGCLAGGRSSLWDDEVSSPRLIPGLWLPWGLVWP